MFYAGRALLDALYDSGYRCASHVLCIRNRLAVKLPFLYLLQYSISDKKESAFRCSRMYASSAVIVFFTLYYISIGSLIYNIIIGGIMLTLTWCSVRGFVYQKKQPGSNKWQFHLAVIVFVALENCLWLSSYPWVSDTWTNPYFWIDFMLTTSIFLILPSVRKAVEA